MVSWIFEDVRLARIKCAGDWDACAASVGATSRTPKPFFLSFFRTYKGLQCCEPDTAAVCTGDDDGLSADSMSESFRNFEGFGIMSELSICNGGHSESDQIVL